MSAYTPKNAVHRVDSVHFEPRTEDGPCSCTCSWTGQASGFTAHRRENGLLQGTSRGDGTPSHWNRKSYKL